MVEHTRHVIYIVRLLTRSSTKLLAHSFLQRSKTSKKQPMAPSEKNLSAIVLLIVIVAAGMYVHTYEI